MNNFLLTTNTIIINTENIITGLNVRESSHFSQSNGLNFIIMIRMNRIEEWKKHKTRCAMYKLKIKENNEMDV